MATPLIRNLAELCDHFSAHRPSDLPRRLYKDTVCGASISLYFTRGKPLHSGTDPRWRSLTRESKIRGFTIQTIVEGSEAEVNSPEFKLPVSTAVVDAWMKEMETEASRLWAEANEEPGGVLAEADAARAQEAGCTCECHKRTRRKILTEVAGMLEGATYSEHIEDCATDAERKLMQKVDGLRRQVLALTKHEGAGKAWLDR